MQYVKVVEQDWQVTQTQSFGKLVIREGAAITAPPGKFVTLTVNGMGHPLKPGTYYGDVVLTVAQCYHMPPHGLMTMMQRSEQFRDAIVVENGKLCPEKCVPAIIQGGTVTDEMADGVSISSSEESFNGILVTGDSQYLVRNARLELDGFGANDFMGVGAGVAAVDNARVTVQDSVIKLSGVTRCAVHAGGDSVVRVERCRLSNHGPDDQGWMGDFSWGVGFVGCNRLVQAVRQRNRLLRGLRHGYQWLGCVFH